MKITSKLALARIKRNRKRTLGTCTAIAISTALVTAVFCFAGSGLAMIKNALGESFGEYADAVKMLVIIPAAILSLLIAFMAVSVISNIFITSAGSSVRELGILKCVGGTGHQIGKTVLSEGIWLSIAGIPAGLIMGTVLGYIGVTIAGSYIDRLTEITRSIIMRRFDLQLTFTVSPAAYPVAALFSFATVILSAKRPAAQVRKITAVECVSFGGDHRDMVKKAGGSRLWKALWGFEGELAARNISRNKKSFKPAIRALATGICLLLVTAGMTSQFADMKKLMQSEHNRLIVDYVSIQEEGKNSHTGRREDKILHPIAAETYNEITDQLNAFGDFEVWGIGSNRSAYTAKADERFFTDEMKQRTEAIDRFGEMTYDMVSVSDGLYRKICDVTGTKYGGNILINTYTYNDSGVTREISPFIVEMKELTLVTPGGEKSTVRIDGFLDREDLDEWLFDFANRAAVLVITPGAPARYFDWYCEPGEQEEEYVGYARQLMNSYFPILTDDSYADQGYSVRISREDTMATALNVMIVLAEVLLYGFVILLALMGFAGFISTITANIRSRSREFAVLKSVGMTGAAIRKMLYSESMYCTAKAALWGSAFGILFPWLINLSVRQAFPVRFHLPVAMTFISIGVTFIIVLIITDLEIKKMKGHSLIETIRMDSTR